ncbi:MAG: F0F1 ATP synthase subunit epsilon [Alphaproteobacteria bacterium]|nr:F0F1 ATP synthase subunit epsilon [Alphaproteobacteria bacterium]MBV9693030.1 F0F1 ATP synthase subunit epsilon [Alphaproteobacteria bacterium]
MTDKISFDLVSPERLLFSQAAEMVTIPGAEGEMGVMAGHMPLISTLKPGVIDARIAHGKHDRFFITGGFAEVTAAKVTVLAEDAVPLASLSAEELDRRIIDAQEDIATAKSDAEMAKATAALDHLRRLRSAM